MADCKWPEGKIYTQAEIDAAVAAALTEAADVAWRFYAKGQVTKPSDIKALIPDAGAALDRALKAEREAGKREMLDLYERVEKEGGCGETAMRMSIRAQGDKT